MLMLITIAVIICYVSKSSLSLTSKGIVAYFYLISSIIRLGQDQWFNIEAGVLFYPES